jgi:hypothetical protein
VIIVTSYDALPAVPDPACADLRGPVGAAGLSPAEVELLNARNDELNAILVAGARKYGFGLARPRLTPLCAGQTAGAPAPTDPAAPAPADPAQAGPGPDLQGFSDRFPFHPTGAGSLRTAAAVARLIAPDTDGN